MENLVTVPCIVTVRLVGVRIALSRMQTPHELLL